jgi:hypothetical protein
MSPASGSGLSCGDPYIDEGEAVRKLIVTERLLPRARLLRWLLAAGLLLLMAPSSSLALSWSAAVNPPRPDADPSDLGPLACPSITLCVAADGYGSGDLVVSTNPLGGAATWTVTTLPGVSVVSSIACPNVSLCVAGDGDGNVWTSTDPPGGFRAWHRAHLESPINTDGLSGMSCPSTSLCVATDDNGNVWSSSDPTGGRIAWHHARIPIGADGINGPASCPTASLCVVLSENGRTYTSHRPLSGGWAVTGSPPNAALDFVGLTCPSANLCVTGGSDSTRTDRVFATSDPNGSSRWTETVLPGSATGGVGVSCSSASQCLAYDTHGGLFSSGTPAAAGSWQASQVGVGVPTNIRCFDSGGCVAVSKAAGVFTAPDATGPWSAGTINGWSPVSAVDCPSDSTCLATDTAGNVLHAVGLAAGFPAWSVVRPAGAGGFGSLACLGIRLCIAGAQHGSLWFSRQPTGAATTWKRQRLAGLGRESGSSSQTGEAGVTVTGIACPSRRLCVAVDDSGDVIATTHPAGGPRSWTVLLRLPSQGTRGGQVPEALTYVTCPSTHLCMAGDPSTPYLEGSEPGMFLISHDPARPGSWHGRRFGLSTVTCPSARLCLAGSADGRLAYTRRLGVGRTSWRYLRLPGFDVDEASGGFASVACAGARLCVAAGGGDGGGGVAESSDPTVARSWRATQLSGSPIVGVGCFRRSVCIAYSQVGELFAGR